MSGNAWTKKAVGGGSGARAVVCLLALVGLAGVGGLPAQEAPRFLVEWGFGFPHPDLGVLSYTIGNAFDPQRGLGYVGESGRIQKFDRDGNFLDE